MIRAIARQAEAERERRAKVIHAEGELQASEHLLAAARVLGQAPQALQLRYLQTLNAIATENNSTIIFPCPWICSGLSCKAGTAMGRSGLNDDVGKVDTNDEGV